MKNTDTFCSAQQNLTEQYLTGEYSLSGACLNPKVQRDFKALLISRRKNPTAIKTAEFLLLIDSDGSRDYVSSLYPKSPGVYHFDYKRIDYELRIKGKDCSISVLEVEHA